MFGCALDFVRERAVSDHQKKLLSLSIMDLKEEMSQETFLPFIELPLHVYGGIRGTVTPAIPLAAAATTLFAGIHLLDDLIDGDLSGEWGTMDAGQVHLTAHTLLSTLPQLMIANLDVPAGSKNLLQGSLATGLLRMADGQMADVYMTGRQDVQMVQVEDALRGKSGEELALFARLAAQMAGAEDPVVRAFDAFGRLLGVACQIASDYYDLFQASTSKDLTRGTRSLPIAFYLEKKKGRERDRVLELLQRARKGEPVREQVTTLLRDDGMVKWGAFWVDGYCRKAFRELEEIRILEPHKGSLCKMVDCVSLCDQLKEVSDGV